MRTIFHSSVYDEFHRSQLEATLIELLGAQGSLSMSDEVIVLQRPDVRVKTDLRDVLTKLCVAGFIVPKEVELTCLSDIYNSICSSIGNLFWPIS